MAFKPRPIRCPDCLRIFTCRSGNQYRCPDCTREAERERKRRYYWDNRETIIANANQRKYDEPNMQRCDRCSDLEHCRVIVMTCVPLPCWREYNKYTEEERAQLQMIPASFRIPEVVG